MNGSPVVILDRDGTVIADRHYLRNPDEVQLLPGAAAGLRRMALLSARLLLVTNQSGIGRGLITMSELEAIHARLRELLSLNGIELSGIFICPHLPQELCDCRKPNTGLVDEAVKTLDLNLDFAFVVGDRACDVELAHNLGIKAVWIRNPVHHDEVFNGERLPHFTVANLIEAAEVIELAAGGSVAAGGA